MPRPIVHVVAALAFLGAGCDNVRGCTPTTVEADPMTVDAALTNRVTLRADVEARGKPLEGAAIDFILVIPSSGAGEKGVAGAVTDERGVAEAPLSGLAVPSVRRDDVAAATHYRAELDPLRQSGAVSGDQPRKWCASEDTAAFDVRL